eukprot:3633558-Prymnesium_polylepis.1
MPGDGTNPYIYPAILTVPAPVRVADRPCGVRSGNFGANLVWQGINAQRFPLGAARHPRFRPGRVHLS